MRKKYKIAALILLLTACLCGCSDRGPPDPLHDALENVVKQDYKAVPGTVGVYIDTTPSMRGFLARDNGSYYSMCLYELGKLVAKRYGEISCYRADTPLWLVENGTEEVLEDARRQNYYYDSNGLSERYKKIESDGKYKYEYDKGYDAPNLTAALTEGEKQDLFILITDFYENSSHKKNDSKLIGKLKSLADADDGKAFGLIAVRSIFAGTIYDTGANGESVYYGDKDESHPAQYRPFYIILRGYPNHVREFCDDFTGRLKDHGMRKGSDYDFSVFHEENFYGLDYTNLTQCQNRLDPEEKGKVWLYSSVAVENAGGYADERKLSVYGYKKRAANKQREDKILYFAYSVDAGRQEEFHALAAEIGEIKTMELPPSHREKEMFFIPCRTQAKKIAAPGDDNTFDGVEGKSGEGAFELDGIYYDQDSETLYAALHLVEREFKEGIWRLQWKNVLDAADSLSPWWENWHSVSGPDADYSKTECLTDYVTPLVNSMPHTGQCILDGTIYLYIKEG